MAKGGTITVHHNKRYRATVTLTGLQQFATNDMVASEFAKYGFADVKVTGSGSQRHAEGRWTGPDTTAEIDPHLSQIVEIA
jgi:hypothetical protein